MFTEIDIALAKHKHKAIIAETYELIKHDPDACSFILNYGEYVEAIDDIIDEEKNPELILKTFNLAMQLFSSPFWIKYHQQLMLVDTLINNQYADSVEWEKSNEQWKKDDAKCMSHVGYDMFFAVVCLVAGRDALRSISSKFRHWAHIKHRLPVH